MLSNPLDFLTKFLNIKYHLGKEESESPTRDSPPNVSSPISRGIGERWVDAQIHLANVRT